MHAAPRPSRSRDRPNRRAVEDVLDRMQARLLDDRTGGSVALGQIVDAIGARGFGPVFLALSLLIISPFGGIPTLPTAFALVMALHAAQMLRGQRSLWVPPVIARREVPGGSLRRAIGWMRPAARRMDRWFGRRLLRLTADPARRIAALTIIALCLIVPPLEFVPFAALIPMSGIALFGLAITMRDGLLMVAAFTAAGAALIGGPALLLSP